MKLVLAGAAVLAAAGIGYVLMGSGPKQAAIPDENAPKALVEIVLPAEMSANAQIGKTAFDAKCAACHGINAVGLEGLAPPLVHIIYEPSHHGDESFQLAVVQGVRSHHWRFGNMPPVEGLTRGDVTMILAYVRELQRANGIH